MLNRAARYGALFLAGAIFGTAYDYIHVYYGVLSYAAPDFHGTELWFVPAEFGVSAAGAGALMLLLGRRLVPPAVSLGRLAFDALLLLAAYLATGLLRGQNGLTTAVLAAIGIVAIAVSGSGERSRRTPFVLVCSGLAATIGPLCEVLLTSLGVFHYNVADPVPCWLPFLWFVAASSFIDVSFLLLAPRASQ